MASSIAGSSISLKSSPQALLMSSVAPMNLGMKQSVAFFRRGAPLFKSAPLRLQISCSAKPETVDKVSDIVKKQLALADGTAVTGETKFAELGADSLDTVEIVMRLEEEFGVSVEEENAQTITTIGEAADMIEKLQGK